jgi:membrane protein DedA with SNARE-associated domain
MEELLARWGYLGVALGTFVAGESVLLAAGAVASKGLLSFPFVALAAFAGSFAWGQVWYGIGRTCGLPLVQRRAAWRERANDVEARIGRHGGVFALGSRFVAGMGLLGPLLLGVSRFPARQFVPLDALGAAAWAVLLTGAGFSVGAGVNAALGHPASWSEIAIGVVALGLVLWLVRRAPGTR